MDFNKWIKKCKSKGQGEGSKFINPNFINGTMYSIDSVKFFSDSSAINTGKLIEGIDVDYFNNKRKDGKPDIGAFEFIPN